MTAEKQNQTFKIAFTNTIEEVYQKHPTREEVKEDRKDANEEIWEELRALKKQVVALEQAQQLVNIER